MELHIGHRAAADLCHRFSRGLVVALNATIPAWQRDDDPTTQGVTS